MHHCKHPHTVHAPQDPRFADDEFTQAAVSERNARAAHAHAGSLLVAALVGILVFGALRRR